MASCDCSDFPDGGEKKENYDIIAGSSTRGDFILANFSPQVNQFDIWSTIIRPHSGVGWNSIQQEAVVEQIDTSVFLQKEKCAKNLTGDVLIVALERKIATEIVDLHAAALLELPLEKLDGDPVHHNDGDSELAQVAWIARRIFYLFLSSLRSVSVTRGV